MAIYMSVGKSGAWKSEKKGIALTNTSSLRLWQNDINLIKKDAYVEHITTTIA